MGIERGIGVDFDQGLQWQPRPGSLSNKCLQTPYEPDAEYVNGEVEERNVGE